MGCAGGCLSANNASETGGNRLKELPPVVRSSNLFKEDRASTSRAVMDLQMMTTVAWSLQIFGPG